MTEPKLSLFQIESELLGLVQQRADALDRHAALSPDDLSGHHDITEEITTIDGLIRDYVKREVRKVDGIALAIKEFTARAAVHAAEAAELAAKAKREEETVERIKQTALMVMQEFGDKKLEGRLYTLVRQGNGGMRALTIAQPDLVPEPYKTVTLRLPLSLLPGIMALMAAEVQRNIREVSRDVDSQQVRYTIEQCEISETNIRKFGEANGWTPEQIATELNKIERVPGCRLEPRGEHLRIK